MLGGARCCTPVPVLVEEVEEVALERVRRVGWPYWGGACCMAGYEGDALRIEGAAEEPFIE